MRRLVRPRLAGMSPTTSAAVWLQRGTVLALSVLLALAVWPWAYDAMELPKWTVIVIGAGFLLALALARLIADGRVTLTVRAPHIPALAFALAAVIAVIASSSPIVSLFGEYRRYGGLWLYLALVVVYFAITSVFSVDSIHRVVYGLIVAAIGVTLVGLLQAAGLDPTFQHSLYGTDLYSTLGNPNFAAGFLGSTFALLLWALFASRRDQWRLVLWGLAAIASAFVIVRTRSLQGVVAAAAGCWWMLVLWFYRSDLKQRRAWLGAVGGAGVASAAVVVLGISGLGPLSFLASEPGIVWRVTLWRAGWRMFLSNPLTGVGLDRYIAFFRAHRSVEDLELVHFSSTGDAAHNVVVHLFSGGGLLLGLAYLAFILTVGGCLFLAVKRLPPDRALLAIAVGGAWFAYHVQALVSIDVASLAALHWMLAGVIVVLAAPPALRQVTWGWRSQPRAAKGRRRRATVHDRVAAATAAVVSLAVVVAATVPLRADMQASRAVAAAEAGDMGLAAQRMAAASERAPWIYEYAYRLGQYQAEAGDVAGALESFERAANTARGDLASTTVAAEAAAALGQHDKAQYWYERALEIEPRHPEFLVIIAEYYTAMGHEDRAQELAQRALEADPQNVQAAELLAGSE